MSPAETSSWLAVDSDGGRALVRTSERFVRRKRRTIRLAGAGTAVVSAGLAFVFPWALGLAAFGVAAVLAAPRLARPTVILEVDESAGRLGGVSIADVREIRGAYEVHGWNPYSTIYAVLADGSEAPIAVLSGADETLPEEACRLAGRLAGRPAVYAGQYGEPRRCFDPAALE